ncbi:hypothetical protein G159_01470 [Planococcus glaciei CHR43]|nr:hypothetical protein G159_01470 [Planococcus glaciei CHR43]
MAVKRSSRLRLFLKRAGGWCKPVDSAVELALESVYVNGVIYTVFRVKESS